MKSSAEKFVNEGGAQSRFANEVAAKVARNPASRRGPALAGHRPVGADAKGITTGTRCVRCLALALALLSASVAACGGRYDDPSTSSTGTGSSTSSESSPASQTTLPMHALGQCVPGFDRNSDAARPCPWVSQKDECFQTMDAACACICPRSGASICSSVATPGQSAFETVYCDPA
jgi:hypothetical protein